MRIGKRRIMDIKNDLEQKRATVGISFMIKIVFALLVSLSLFAPVALGQTGQTETVAPPIQLQIPIPGINGRFVTEVKDFGEYFLAFYVFFVGIVGILATIMVMYGGYRWIAAAGNASRIQGAKETMSGAIIGLVLALTSFLLLNLINPQLVRVRVPHLEVISKIGQPFSIYCDDTQPVERDGVPVLPGLRQCGQQYNVIEGGFVCSGWHCPQGQVCNPITDTCGPAEQVCESQTGGDIKRACERVDFFLARSGDRTNGCRTGYKGIYGDDPHECVYTPVIQNRNDYRVFDCDIAGPAVDTDCWENGRAKKRGLRSGYTGWCAQKSDQRAGTLTDTTCALQPGTDPIRCQVDQPSRMPTENKWFAVECARIGITSCTSPNKCWVRIVLVQHSL